jgi:hypothetical protein
MTKEQYDTRLRYLETYAEIHLILATPNRRQLFLRCKRKLTELRCKRKLKALRRERIKMYGKDS